MTRHLQPVPPTDGDTPPHNTAAERALLGAAMLSPRAITDVEHDITSTDFYEHRHELIWDAITHLTATGIRADAITVADHLGTDLARAGGPAYLHELINACPVAANAPHYAHLITTAATRRRDLTTAHELARLAHDPSPEARARTLTIHQTALDTRPAPTPTHTPLPVDQFLNTLDDDYDWLVPGFLERGDRLILTAAEGAGKSTLLRQWAVQLAAAIHPFTQDPLPHPLRVLILDLENSDRQTRRALRPLTIAAGPRLTDPTNLLVLCKPDGLDLTDPTDVAWLDQLLTTTHPDLLITGPIYKLAGGDPNDEKEAKPAALAIDRLRDRHGIAVLLEAHTKKGENAMSKTRAKEPFGWSGWMRWPEIGMHLAVDGEITHWRGLRDISRAETIPALLTRGGNWPWTTVSDPDRLKLEKIMETCETLGKIASAREIESATGISKSAVDRIMKRYGARVEALRYRLSCDQKEGE